MARRRKSHPHVSHERWLISYADFITLLFAFFVVLYASSRVDNHKVIQVATAIQVAFHDLGLFTPASTQVTLEEVAPTAPISSNFATAGASDASSSAHADPNSIAALKRQLQVSLASEIAKRHVTLKSSKGGLVISLKELGFFDSGSATLRKGSEATLDRIAASLEKMPNPIRIEGHTDNRPIHTAQFASNWELSTARATTITRLFIEHYKFDPMRLSAAGYAEFHPAASNDTPEGRQANRRVDLVVQSPDALDLENGPPAMALPGAGALPPAAPHAAGAATPVVAKTASSAKPAR